VRSSAAQAGPELAERLRARQAEIEQATLTRVHAIADTSLASDPTYVDGLRGAVSAALEYGIAATELGGERDPAIPVSLLAQARMAARSGVSLDTVLRRYFAGYSLLGYFLIEEASREGLMSGAELQRLLGTQAVIFDRLLAAIGEEHTRESELAIVSSEQRQAERIERLLEGELIDTAGIAYDFEGRHLGAIASGPGAAEALRDLARTLDLRPLIVRRGEESTVWAWLGARRRPDPSAAMSFAAANWADDVLLAIGEPGLGLSGWRLSHRQAAAALPVAQRGRESPVRYADVALPASALQDDLLSTSLRQLYLRPLEGERDGGAVLRETLRAYLSANGSLSSAATTMSVSPRTIGNRLRRVEEVVGRPLHTALADIEIALRLDGLDAAAGLLNQDPERRLALESA
jgi:PucR C-terminal helix-turn-helix domain/GGDEF-like domain